MAKCSDVEKRKERYELWKKNYNEKKIPRLEVLFFLSYQPFLWTQQAIKGYFSFL